MFFCLQSFQASGSFPISQLFASSDQSIGASTSASVLPTNIQGLFPLGLTGSISLQSKGLSKVFLQHHSSKASILLCSACFMVQLFHPYMATGKTMCVRVTQSCLTLCDPMACSQPWDLPGKNTGVGCHFLLQGIFPMQESNPGLLHCRQILYQLTMREAHERVLNFLKYLWCTEITMRVFFFSLFW